MSDLLDLVVLGGSAGSHGVLRGLINQLPADLPATVMICQHQPQGAGSRLADILAQTAALRVVQAQDGMPLRPGEVVVAAPDLHMMAGTDHVHLRRGAHENNFRPAIDPLFRSAAVYRGRRAIGIILSGLLDDGASGARALAMTGGQVLVQAPETAEFPDMPQATLAAVPEAEPLDVEGIAARIRRLAGTPAGSPTSVPMEIGLELKISSLEGASMESEQKLGDLSPYNCPHCNGVLWEIEDGPILRYRCHTGHAYTLDALNAAQEEALDRKLFDALRAHRGRVSLIRRLAARTRPETTKKMLLRRADRVEEDAGRLETIIRSRGQAN